MKTKKVFPFMVIAMLAVSSFVACNKHNQGDIRQTGTEESKYITKSSGSCSPTTGSLPVSITPQNADAVIDQYAAMHNAYLDYYFASLSSQTLTFPSSQYDAHFRNTAATYFGSQSVTVNSDFYQCVESSRPETDLKEFRTSFSPAGLVIYDQLCSLADGYDMNNHNQFVASLNALYANCNSLAFTEQVRLKFAIKIAINSYTYWKDNGETWINYYEDTYGGATASNQQKANQTQRNQRILSNAGKADLKGAVRGAITGLGGGVAGAVAGGLVGAGVYSASSIVWDAIFG